MTQLSRQADTLLPQAAPAAELRQSVSDLLELTKVRITVMVVITAGIGYLLGTRAAAPGNLAATWLTGIGALLGTALACMGASALNQLFERDTDALMQRTRQRPLPAGRVQPAAALLLAVVLSVMGVAVLGLLTTSIAAAVAAATIFSYAMIYTPLKRLSGTSLIVGAVPGALPPVIGYAAATGQLGLAGWLVFAIMFVWQVPHFLAIAWLYREDYARAGFPMLPVTDPTGTATFTQMILWCLLLLPVSLLPAAVGLAGPLYATIAAVSGLGFLACSVRLMIRRDRTPARIAFIASLIYLPVVLAALVFDMV
jgi:heme o synthase